MRTIFSIILILCFLLCIPVHADTVVYGNNVNSISHKIFDLQNPLSDLGNSYKGQMHTHTTNSDGLDSSTDLVTAYRDAGYSFVVVTDHDYVTESPGVIGILYIPGAEETSSGHILSVNAQSQVVSEVGTDILNSIVSNGGVAFMAHPMFLTYPWTESELKALYPDYAGITLKGSGVETLWDAVLSDNKPIWGIYEDDCHDISDPSNFNTGWVMVNAGSLSISNIVESLRDGNFYASTSPTLSVVVGEQNTINVTTDNYSTIEFIGQGGGVLKTVTGSNSGTYQVVGNEVYIRVKITYGSKYAWSNPIFIGGN